MRRVAGRGDRQGLLDGRRNQVSARSGVAGALDCADQGWVHQSVSGFCRPDAGAHGGPQER